MSRRIARVRVPDRRHFRSRGKIEDPPDQATDVSRETSFLLFKSGALWYQHLRFHAIFIGLVSIHK